MIDILIRFSPLIACLFSGAFRLFFAIKIYTERSFEIALVTRSSVFVYVNYVTEGP